ncbi:CKLF-like MARVEL transmembrane domain-containing protein 7 isoform X3 [Rhineura floridana]|uniref:CKLF-like MARVEL transmembrane domain-containing protein 7 isoform X3 n=1 Tax=Rhineura floridana TaxID=261503 RepID=UPI002AC835D3|nr:CKLF-like MARVEL transmembrane domain-containing protein 7 isoform X3 [Rhineura floridana]
MSHGVRVIRTDASSGSASAPSSAFGSDSGLLDRGYAGSYSAMLKVAQMLLLLIGFICIRSSRWIDHSTYTYFEIISMYDLVMILIFYIVYIFRIYRMLACINWPLAAFGFLASFLCILSIWLSYKVSCVTQSTDAAV